MVENVFFGLSRLYVPAALFRLYRRGLFDDHFSFTELKYIFRMVVVMHCIDLFGHFLFRYLT